jgi:hypothetical protein
MDSKLQQVTASLEQHVAQTNVFPSIHDALEKCVDDVVSRNGLDSYRSSVDLSERSVITLHSEYEYIPDFMEFSCNKGITPPPSSRNLHPLRNRERPLVKPLPLDMMHP